MNTTMLVVHDVTLRRELHKRAALDMFVVAPGGATMGRRVVAVVFVDSPGTEELLSTTWRAMYRDWFHTAVLTRLGPDCANNVFGASPILCN